MCVSRQREVREGRRVATVSEKTFDGVMETIAQGLNGDSEHDIAYLKEQAEAYKNHEFGQEITRACGRLMWEALPDDKKAEIQQVMDNHGASAQSVIDEANYNMKMGNPAKALELIEPLAKKYDDLTAEGWGEDDRDSVHFDFDSIIEHFVWRAHSNEERTVRSAVEPFALVYFTYGSVLYEAGGFEDAIVALEKAIRWNPAKPMLRFELGENYKKLGDMETYNRVLDETHPYIATADDMARFHRSKGFLLIEMGSYELAAAHLMYSLLYGNSELALSEVMYIKMQFGEDYTGMTPETAGKLLESKGELCVANEDTLSTLYALIKIAIDNEDVETAIKSAINLYQLTGDEEIGDIARNLIKAVEEAQAEAGGNGN